MPEIALVLNRIILFSAMMSIVFVIYILISLISIIYNKISFKTTFKEWLTERKYFLLFYFYFFLLMTVMVFLMLFGFLGIIAAILIFTIASGILISIKNRVVFYTEENTTHSCTCGREIIKVIKVEVSGYEKTLYYICRVCGKKYSKNELPK